MRISRTTSYGVCAASMVPVDITRGVNCRTSSAVGAGWLKCVAREPNPIGIPDGIDFGPPVIRTAVLKTGVYNIISGSIDTLSIETTVNNKRDEIST